MGVKGTAERVMVGTAAGAAVPRFGDVLRHWRLARRMSQLTLATEAEISTRHLSFLETGRAQPSREMVLLLAGVLDVPLRDQNVLLTAAGYASIYRETALGAPELSQVRRALGFILAQQEPYPALVVDRHWNLLMQNEGARRLLALFLDPEEVAQVPGPSNVVRMTFHPRGLRRYIANWEALASPLIQQIHRALAYSGCEGAIGAVLAHGPAQGRPHGAVLQHHRHPGHAPGHHPPGASSGVLLPRRRGHRGARPPPRTLGDKPGASMNIRSWSWYR